jgi:hypothetical protein
MQREEIIARANKAVNDAFEVGAELELKRIIDKACIFIRQNIDLYAMDTVDARTMKHKIVLMTDFEKAFRKAMEE